MLSPASQARQVTPRFSTFEANLTHRYGERYGLLFALFLPYRSYQHPTDTIFNSKLDSITTLDSLK